MPKRFITLTLILTMLLTSLSSCEIEGIGSEGPEKTEVTLETSEGTAITAEEENVAPEIANEEHQLTLNGHACGYTVTECGYLDGQRFKEKALNYTGEDQLFYTSWLFKAESVAELREIFDLMQPSYVHKMPEYDAEAAFNSRYGSYTDAFFENYALIVVYRDSSSGGHVFNLSSVRINNNRMTVSIVQTSTGNTCDMSGWFFRIAIPKSALEGVTEYITQ